MYKKILLLMDCSPVDETILNHILQLAKIHKSTVHLFHVVHAHTLDQQRVLVAQAEECLARAQAALEKEHIVLLDHQENKEPNDLVGEQASEDVESEE